MTDINQSTVHPPEVDRSPVTKRDLVEQNFPKIFPQPPRGDIVGGSFTPDNLSVMIDFAKAMATARQIGGHLQGNVGDCLFIVSKAIHHKLEPYSLAMLSYEVNGRIQFEAKFATALLHSSGLLRQRLRYTYTGEGEERTCSVSGHFRNEEEPLVYTSPPLARITPKKSPLWTSDPDQQLSYYSARAWGRRYASDVLAGFHFEGDEDHLTIDMPAAIRPSDALRKRLEASQSSGEGFDAAAIERTLSASQDGADVSTHETRPSHSPYGAPGELALAGGSIVPGEDGKRRADRPATEPEPSRPPRRTPLAYRKHLTTWLAGYGTEQSIEERWRQEARLRNQCGVTAKEKDRLRSLIDQRIAALRNA